MKKNLLLLVGLTLLLSSCQTVPYQGQARDVKLKPGKEGVLGLPINPKTEDRALAKSRMSENCGSKYEVLEEGEVVVGQETRSNASESQRARSKTKVGSLFGIPITSGDEGGSDTSTHSVTSQVKEWQISYKCL